MKPLFSRQSLADRHLPQIRWSAVLAGALVAAALWLLLHLLFVGGALSAIGLDDVEHARAVGIGTGVGSVLAPLLALVAGGALAGRLAAHRVRWVTALHGVLVWAATMLLGLVLMARAVGALAGTTAPPRFAGPASETRAYVEDVVRHLANHLRSQGAPPITVDALIEASDDAGGDGMTHGIDRDAFVVRLDELTALSRPEAKAVLERMGDRADEVIGAAHTLALARRQAWGVVVDAGGTLVIAGLGLLACLIAAVAGALVVNRVGREPDDDATVPGSTTAPYPLTAHAERDARE